MLLAATLQFVLGIHSFPFSLYSAFHFLVRAKTEGVVGHKIQQ